MQLPTLEESLDKLQHIEAFQVVREHIRGQYEDAIREMIEATADKLQMKAGEIAAYREILDLIENR